MRKTWRMVLALLSMLGVAVGVVAYVGWYKLLREAPVRESFRSPAERFKYGSLAAETDQGIPFWIFVVLPRVFPEFLPRPGGYAALGLNWEEGHELPIGFTKRVVGFPRVANNCAVCHTASYRITPDEPPRFVVAGPAHTSNAQALLRFLTRCANDPRFNANDLLAEIEQMVRLSWLDRLLYRFVIIPLTRQRLIERGADFAWMNRPGWPDWSAGRDDPMNLTKYFMLHEPYDHSVGAADFPAIWNLHARPDQLLNWDGATTSARSVIIDSALGLGAPPKEPFLQRMQWLEEFLRALPAPKYPLPIDAGLVAQGKPVFDRYCADCHGEDGARTRKVIDIAEIGTDRERLDTWTQVAADGANATVKSFGIDRTPMIKTNGYIGHPMDGIWLRAPYLHNGSVPTLRDLLEPPAQRPASFYRGYDVLDGERVGFVTAGADAKYYGVRFDTSLRGNGNGGHVYGTELPPAEKDALIEFLKTL